MSQEAYTRFSPQLKPGGILITEQELVQHRPPAHRRPRLRRPRHPAGRGIGPQDGAQHRDGRLLRRRHASAGPATRCGKAVADSVPPAMQKLNLQAFDKGFDYGANLLLELSENRDADQVSLLESV